MNIKKTYIPSKPRNPKLVNSGGVAGGVSSSSAGSTDPNSHTHQNKPVIDQLTQADIDVLAKMSLVDGNLKVDTNLYSTGEVSAYGLGEGSDGGGGSLVVWGTTTNNFSPLTVEGISKIVALQGHTHSKSEVGLSNVDNVKQLPLSQKGAVGGVAELDENGKVLASQLPSYVDDVLEYTNLAGFPTTGETGKIYTALDTNKIYRWSGTTYVEISSSLALGETSSTAYRGDRGKIAYEHSQSAHAPASAQKNSDITKAEIEAKLTGIITSHSHTVTKADVGLGNVLNVASYSKTETDDLLSSLNVGVTSIGLTAPTGFSVSNSPITSTGNIALAFATGYSLPTTAKQGQWDTAFTNSHTHANKTQLDLITQSNIDVLAKLSIVNGNLQIDGNAYATGELSAYGVGDGGGGGGGIIETVYGYNNLGQTFNNSILTNTFNAYTINQINTRLVSVESGSATTVNTTGTGNAITSISKAGSVITANKDLTFSLSNHLHSASDITSGKFAIARIPTGIAEETVARGNHDHTGVYEPAFDKNAAFNKNFGTTSGTVAQGNDSRIVNGQTAFGWGNHATAGYALNSAFNNHNNDNVRHITGAERTKWDGVVTDFAELEIGGRNLLENSKKITTFGRKYFTDSFKTITISFDLEILDDLGDSGQLAFFIYGDGVSLGMWKYFISDALTGRYSLTISYDTPIVSIHMYRDAGNTGVVRSFIYHNFKVEKGNKATDWTPAPEDVQASIDLAQTNLTTHATNISNPHSVTKLQVGLGNVDNTSDLNKPISTATQTALNLKANLASPTFTGTVTAPTFIGALSGNADTATALQTARTLWGQSFNGEANVSGAMTGVTSLAMTGALSGATTIEASTSVTTPKVIFNSAGWSMEQVGSELQMKHNNVLKMRFTSTGSIVATEEITAFG